ncbi:MULTISPECIES: AAA family ATPase [Pseudoalteromonas]|nr:MULTISPECIES: AAA family ATPase [Pseudoalteromonas]
MDLANSYKRFVETTKQYLGSGKISKSEFYCLALLQAIVRLDIQGKTEELKKGVKSIHRKVLQTYLTNTYPSKENARPQEVNLYLSQRFNKGNSIEPDFIGFTLNSEEGVYFRETDDVPAGETKESYFIRDFEQRAALIGFVDSLDLTELYEKLFSQGEIQYEEYPWIKKCLAYESFKNFLKKKNVNLKALNDAIRIISESHLSFDFYQVHTEYSPLRIGRKEVGADKGSKAAQFEVYKGELIFWFPATNGRDEEIVINLTDDLALNETKINEVLEEDSQFFIESGLVGENRWPKDYDEESDIETSKMESFNMGKIPLNQILYGPPGTGKTFHTIEAAVKAIDPETIWEGRKDLKNKYDQLVKEKCIRFVTFHQSYGYEEFVEGLTAKTTEEGNVTYQIKNGIFKSICEDALAARLQLNQEINPDGQVWKISIEGTYQNNAKTYCLENGLAAIGWPDTGSLLTEPQNDYFKSLGRNDRNSLMYLAKEMNEGDLILCINSRSSVEAVGVIGSDYLHNEQGIPTRPDYSHQRKVKWLSKGFSVDFKDLNDGKLFNLPTCYPLSRMNVKQVLNHLAENGVKVGEANQTNSAQNYVLVIDEINRGNISKIFGELITLIEPSKRKGQDEAITLTLPSSGQPFSVPDNVYIIGTMNTADRSLAMMDTALRRRFDFVEMMPNYKVLEGKVINYKEVSIDLSKLLQVMNKRIEVLYDREHTLGHAFLMPVVTLIDNNEHKLAFEALISVFKNKIVPLLEEYFFEDWNKIRLVLGDNTKANDGGLQFVSKSEQLYDDIFGSNHGLSSYEDKAVNYQIKAFDGKNSPWQNPKAYQLIYANSPNGNL